MAFSQPFWQQTEDWHTAGEPFRIVRDLPAGSLNESLTVPEQRLQIINTPSHPLDLLRQSLCHEPRGHADMYGGFVTAPNDDLAHFGVLFWHKDGFSTACGHGTIALGYWAISNGFVQRNPGGTTEVVIDVPSGRVAARATFDDNGAVLHMEFINIESYQISKGDKVTVNLDGGQVTMPMDLSFAGAVYGCVNAADLHIAIEPRNHQKLIHIARQIKAQRTEFLFLEKYDIYGVCFYEDQGETANAVYQRNVVVFADGQIDRSPCGSGTCARLAVLLAEGRVTTDKGLVHESIVGSKFEAHALTIERRREGFPSCLPRVRGTAKLVGKMNFYIDPTDPIYPGFVFR